MSVFFFPTSKKGNTNEYSDYRTIVLIAHLIEVMLKMLRARLYQYANQELPNVQTEKAEEPEIKLPAFTG